MFLGSAWEWWTSLTFHQYSLVTWSQLTAGEGWEMLSLPEATSQHLCYAMEGEPHAFLMGGLLSPVQVVRKLGWTPLTHFIVPIKPGSAISHGAVKLLITDVEETRLVKSEFVLHGDQGSPPQRKPQRPTRYLCPESESMRWKWSDVCLSPTRQTAHWQEEAVILLILRAERCLGKKCWLTGALALLFVLVVEAH